MSLMVADRALWAAEDADDPLRIAAVRWNLGHVLLSRPGQEAEAAEVELSAADELGRTLTAVDAVAVRGAEVDVGGAGARCPAQAVPAVVEVGEGLQASGDADARAGHPGGGGAAVCIAVAEVHRVAYRVPSSKTWATSTARRTL
ncbi:hypothetical protein N0O83_36320 [Streptomyces atratus]|nr:hypothetical protein [Streptomyces atratus]MCT2548217.1 hypothetical protein [Streptomyces atratus]